MYNLDNLVDEDDDLILKTVSSLCELFDSDYAKDHLNTLSRHHDIHEVFIPCEIL